ncbi:MAG TPA: FtsX-like permease family protein [Sphingomonas sp.]|nr:FtsX-like permease family protein [Sphingomonas sp.]
MVGATAADRRLLPEGRLAGPMPWVIAIMIFLTALAAAAGMAMGAAADRLGGDLGRRITVQILNPDPTRRDAESAAVTAAIEKETGVLAVNRVGADAMRALLKPWLGDVGLTQDLPLPAMIDVDLSAAGRARLDAIVTAAKAAGPDVRVDDHARWIAPLIGLIRSLGLLAGLVVALMVGATAAAVVLAARSALDTHRETIEVMHRMGATDVQIARLFQRRIALDALFGGIVGLIGAAAVILTIGTKLAAIGSGLVGSVSLPGSAWLVLVCMPPLAGLLALVVARATVLRALGRTL